MTADKQRFSKDMREEELNKYRYAIRMIADVFIEDYEDVYLNTKTFRLKGVTRIITGLDVISVQIHCFVIEIKILKYILIYLS